MAVNCLENSASSLSGGTEFDSLAFLHIRKMPLNGGQSGSNPEDAVRRGVRFALLPPSPVSVMVAPQFETLVGVVRLHDLGPIYETPFSCTSKEVLSLLCCTIPRTVVEVEENKIQMKIHFFGDGNLGPRGGKMYGFHCPGCEYGHCFEVPTWSWNGSFDKPTFAPSLLVNQHHPPTCHLYMKDGMIQFLSDCNHKLAGQTVECPEWE